MQRSEEKITQAKKIELLLKEYEQIATCTNKKSLLDKEIVLKIYKKVENSFNKVAKLRKETLKNETIFYIFFVFIEIFENSDKDFFNKHLKYQIDYYKKNGLRKELNHMYFNS